MRNRTKDDDAPAEGQDQQEEALNDVATPLPTIGRIVHLKIDEADGIEVLRPALVLGHGDVESFLHLQVFLYPHDMPFAPGTRIRVFDRIPGAFFARAPEGDEVGSWRWPEQVLSVAEATLESTD